MILKSIRIGLCASFASLLLPVFAALPAQAEYAQQIGNGDACGERSPVSACRHDTAGADADLQTASTLRPKGAAAYFARGDTEAEQAEYSAAAADYARYLDLDPQPDAAVYYNLGAVLAGARDIRRAVAWFSAYTKLRPEDANGWSALGDCRARLSDWSAALDADTRALKLKPDDLETIKRAGAAQYNLRLWRDARAHLARYHAAYPKDADVSRMLAQIASKESGAQEAVLKVDQALNSADDSAWATQALAQLSDDRYLEAAASMTHAIEIHPSPARYYNRGYAYLELAKAGDAAAAAKAEADARAALHLKPDLAAAQYLLADAEFAARKYREAQSDYASYQTLAGVATENRTLAAKQVLLCAAALKNYPDVIRTATALVAADPNDAESYRWRGMACLQMRDYAAAIADLQRYGTLQPEDAEALFDLGTAQHGNADTDAEAVSFQGASDLDPSRFDFAWQGAQAFQSLASAHPAAGAPFERNCEKAMSLFRRAADFSEGKQKRDALAAEAAILEMEARITGRTELSSAAKVIHSEAEAAGGRQ